jgi:misacylated tRNA(Ala) deacylase
MKDLVSCQRDARLQSLMVDIVRCDAVDGAYELVLSDTVLYPEGGGQPADHGSIEGPDGSRAQVVDVQWRDGVVVHRATGSVGTGRVRVTVDWPRRFDHMRQHSAQHLITATALARHGAATVGFHLGAERSTIDLDRELDPTALADIEDAVNKVIVDDVPVHVRVGSSPAEAAALGARSRAIRAGWEGPIRLVEIEGIDLNTCGGTHVARMGELGLVCLVDAERYKGGTRVHFVAGDRVRSALAAGARRERDLSSALSCHPADHAEAVERLRADARESHRAARAARRELHALLGSDAARQPDPVLVQRPEADLASLSEIARALQDARPGATALLVGGPSEDGVFLLVGPPERVRAVGPSVAAALGGRGGGPPGRYQGRGSTLSAAPTAVHLLSGPSPDGAGPSST